MSPWFLLWARRSRLPRQLPIESRTSSSEHVPQPIIILKPNSCLGSSFFAHRSLIAISPPRVRLSISLPTSMDKKDQLPSVLTLPPARHPCKWSHQLPIRCILSTCHFGVVVRENLILTDSIGFLTSRNPCFMTMMGSLLSSDVHYELRTQGKECRVDRHSMSGSGM